MEFATSKDGTIISYRKEGTGSPLLLVHGTTADHTRWSGITDLLKSRFTVYAMDRRGRGKSSDAPDYHLFREAEDVAAVLNQIGEPVFLLGHSYGAVCALEASLLTENIRRMILYEPPVPTGIPLYPPGTPGRMQALIDGGKLENALEIFFREVVNMPDHEFEIYRRLPLWNVRIKLSPTIPRELAIDRSYQFESHKFTGLNIPVMLILGGDSPPLFRNAINAVHEALPQSCITILPGQQHIAIDTAPELFTREVLHFLEE